MTDLPIAVKLQLLKERLQHEADTSKEQFGFITTWNYAEGRKDAFEQALKHLAVIFEDINQPK